MVTVVAIFIVPDAGKASFRLAPLKSAAIVDDKAFKVQNTKGLHGY